jgi:hypothetical protein
MIDNMNSIVRWPSFGFQCKYPTANDWTDNCTETCNYNMIDIALFSTIFIEESTRNCVLQCCDNSRRQTKYYNNDNAYIDVYLVLERIC